MEKIQIVYKGGAVVECMFESFSVIRPDYDIHRQIRCKLPDHSNVMFVDIDLTEIAAIFNITGR